MFRLYQKNTPTVSLILHQFDLDVLLICGKKLATINIFLVNFFGGGGGGVKMRDKMAIPAYILKIVENDPFLRLQMRAKKDFNRRQSFFHKYAIRKE